MRPITVSRSGRGGAFITSFRLRQGLSREETPVAVSISTFHRALEAMASIYGNDVLVAIFHSRVRTLAISKGLLRGLVSETPHGRSLSEGLAPAEAFIILSRRTLPRCATHGVFLMSFTTHGHVASI